VAKEDREGVEEMTLDKFTQTTYFEIWSPRYHDKKVLLNAKKIKDAKTQWLKIKFTKAPSMEGDWCISKQKAMTFPLDTNGTIQCRAIPLSALEPLEINQNDIRSVI
jgi:hypothetical protein